MRNVLLITGASKGIGFATAQHFIEQQFKVINLSRNPCELDGVVNIKVDLLDLNAVQQCRQQLLEEIAQPEQLVLVHNAAMMSKETVAEINAHDLHQTLQLNVVASAQLNVELLPVIEQCDNGGAIIYIGSTLSTKAVANTHSYVISKHAVVGQMRATCQDLAGKQIHTACVCPGFTETEMLKKHLGENPDVYQSIVAGVTLKRLTQPREIAETIWFCSQNPVINGSVVHANLGQVEH